MIDMSANPDMRDKLTHIPRRSISRRTPGALRRWCPVRCRSHWKEWVNPQLGQRSRDPMQAQDGIDLVGRTVRQHDRPPRSGDRRDEGVPASGQRLSSHRRDRCQGQRLVHRQQERHGRLSSIRRPSKITVFQDARPECEGPAYAGVRSQGHRAGSRCRTATWSAASIRRAATSSSSRLSPPGAKPYGIKIDAEGNPWFSCNGAPCLYKINPANVRTDRDQAAA